MSFVLIACVVVVLAGLLSAIRAARRREELRKALAQLNTDLPKNRVESVIRSALRFGTENNRFNGRIEQEARDLQLIAAAWEVIEMSRPGAIALAGLGTPAEQTAIVQCAIAAWCHLSTQGVFPVTGQQASDEAFAISMNFFVRPAGGDLGPFRHATLELSKDKSAFFERLEAAVSRLSATPERDQLRQIGEIVEERLEKARALAPSDQHGG